MIFKKIYKTNNELKKMVLPGLATEAALKAAKKTIIVGNSENQVDKAAEKTLDKFKGAKSNFKLVPGYKNMTCVSVNDQVVHGIPTDYIFRAGDIVSVDAGVIIDGWNGDSAFTFVIPDENNNEQYQEAKHLSDITEESLWIGIAELASAKHLNQIGGAIEDYIKSKSDFGILRDYVGHGIGRSMHEEPPVYNYRVRERGAAVKPGLVIAIEPMVVAGKIATKTLADDWTVVTKDGSLAAHWEHTVAVHDDGIWVLTKSDGGASGLKKYGITPVPIPD